MHQDMASLKWKYKVHGPYTVSILQSWHIMWKYDGGEKMTLVLCTFKISYDFFGYYYHHYYYYYYEVFGY